MDRQPIIGVLAPLLGGFYYGSIISSIHSVLRESGARLVAIQTGDEQTEAPLPRLEVPLAQAQVDGWITIVSAVSDPFLLALQATGKPLVTISHLHPDHQTPAILPDNRGGASAATRHLIAHGHQRIAFVGDLSEIDIQQRLEGYQAALAAAGLPFDPGLVFAAPNNLQSGGQAAARALIDAGRPCTAAVVATDTNALGLMHSVQEAGWRIPDDLAVVGFDDIEAGLYAAPALTSIRQRFDIIGQTAAQVLLSHIGGTELLSGPLYVATQLVQRQSCGCQAGPGADAHRAEHPTAISYSAQRSLETALEHMARISRALIAAQPAGGAMDWMRWTAVRWGCLALWGQADSAGRQLVIDRAYSAKSLAGAAVGARSGPERFPPLDLLASDLAPGDVITVHPVRTALRDWGVLALAGPLEALALGGLGAPEESGLGVPGLWATLLGAGMEREALRAEALLRTSALEQAQIELGAAYRATRQELAERRRAEEELRRHQEELESLIAARTAELTGANARLQELAGELRAKNEYMQRGLEVAREIQIGLLPRSVPWDPGLAAVFPRSLPALEVGGDFYTFVAFRERHLAAIAIGDISGKGVGAACMMSLVSHAVDAAARRYRRPGRTLAELNASLGPHLRSNTMNAALLLLLIDAEQQTLTVANAGMIPPFVLRHGHLTLLDCNGLPLGALDEAVYHEQTLGLLPGDLLVLISDGVVEARDGAGQLFGFERLERWLLAGPSGDPAAQIAGLFEQVGQFIDGAAQQDDMTALAIRPTLNGPPPPARSGIDPARATVLLVEDNPDDLFILMELLESEVGVGSCAGHTAGWRMFEFLEANPERQIDLILLDMHIPYEDGYAVLHRIRKLPALSATLVVAVTAETSPQNVEAARQAGFHGFIGKPIGAARFPEQIRRVLAGEAVWEPQ